MNIRKSAINVIPHENHVLTDEVIGTSNIETQPQPVTEHEPNPHKPFHPSHTAVESNHAQTEQCYQSLSHHCSIRYTGNHLSLLETSLYKLPSSTSCRFGN